MYSKKNDYYYILTCILMFLVRIIILFQRNWETLEYHIYTLPKKQDIEERKEDSFRAGKATVVQEPQVKI